MINSKNSDRAQLKRKAEHMAKTVALQIELEEAIDLVHCALKIVASLDNVDCTNYAYINCLSNGYERLLKIIIIGKEYQFNSNFPVDNKIIKNKRYKYGHGIKVMYDDIHNDLTQASSFQLKTELGEKDSLISEYLQLLEDFAQYHRYGNLDKIVSPEPFTVKHNVFEKIRSFISRQVSPLEREELSYEAEDILAIYRFIDLNKFMLSCFFVLIEKYQITSQVSGLASSIKLKIEKLPSPTSSDKRLNTYSPGLPNYYPRFWRIFLLSKKVKLYATDFTNTWPFKVNTVTFLQYKSAHFFMIHNCIFGINGYSKNFGVNSYFKSSKLKPRSHAMPLIENAKQRMAG